MGIVASKQASPTKPLRTSEDSSTLEATSTTAAESDDGDKSKDPGSDSDTEQEEPEKIYTIRPLHTPWILSLWASESEFLRMKQELKSVPRGTWCNVTSEKKLRSWMHDHPDDSLGDMPRSWTNNLGKPLQKQQEWKLLIMAASKHPRYKKLTLKLRYAEDNLLGVQKEARMTMEHAAAAMALKKNGGRKKNAVVAPRGSELALCAGGSQDLLGNLSQYRGAASATDRTAGSSRDVLGNLSQNRGAAAATDRTRAGKRPADRDFATDRPSKRTKAGKPRLQLHEGADDDIFAGSQGDLLENLGELAADSQAVAEAQRQLRGKRAVRANQGSGESSDSSSGSPSSDSDDEPNGVEDDRKEDQGKQDQEDDLLAEED
eukprot:g12122.t1